MSVVGILIALGLLVWLAYRLATLMIGSTAAYRDIVMTAIVGPIISLVAVIGLGSGLSSF